MTIFTLVLYVAIVAALFTGITQFVLKKVNNLLVSFLQHFCGVLFVFSGFVKAIDPLGTAYKMEQYFAKFESTFEGTWFSFVAPMFPLLTKYVNGFSVFMIVFEILLGVMLIIGSSRRFTAWAFFLLVLFFTFLTGFTYLSGFVSPEDNFFAFSKWGEFVETNMQVTDCGCFGDFLKLKPKVSFLKDLLLMIPAIIFIVGFRKMHQLFTMPTRSILNVATVAGLTLYCFNNYIWDIPAINFRPFKPGVDVVKQKEAEEKALQEVKILAYRLTDKKTKQVIEVPYDQFLKELDKYPGEKYEFDQVKSEPAIPITKINDFDLTGPDGSSVTEDWKGIKGYHFMVVAYKLYGEESGTKTETIQDTIYKMGPDSTKVVDSIATRTITKKLYTWDEEYLAKWKKLVAEMTKAKEDGAMVYAITSPYDPVMIDAFKEKTGFNFLVLRADDILLKTIIRSNPGVLLFKDGTIVEDWHIRKFPSFEEVKTKYMK
ncbi:MauE/DoxX family redox-associated membrane protein [Haliscomenobacter sp.]|uniref:MauE/DoxX family redox-associated membrane protein n=1 Tax=Haliscomenobacter sp. TaxID=2717303 RepID=UPI0035947946